MMKKNLFSFYGVISLTIILATASNNAYSESHDDLCHGVEAKPDSCPKVWVEVCPAFFPQSPADHTYVKFLEKNGHWKSFPCFGACKGGNELTDTKSSTWENNKKIIQFMANAAPCKWTKHNYLIIGVCHQLANRSLFHTDKIVKNARMYKWSSFVYGTYGACFWPLKEYCMTNCREVSAKIGSWQRGAPPPCMPQKTMPTEPDAEHQLYMELFGDLQATKRVQDMADLLKSYRGKLLKLHIKQRLGDKYMRDYLPMLSEGQDALLNEKEKLDLWLSKKKSVSDDVIVEYNNLFNKSLNRFRDQMPRDIYEQFFGLAYDAKIDMQIFLPKE